MLIVYSLMKFWQAQIKWVHFYAKCGGKIYTYLIMV